MAFANSCAGGRFVAGLANPNECQAAIPDEIDKVLREISGLFKRRADKARWQVDE